MPTVYMSNHHGQNLRQGVWTSSTKERPSLASEGRARFDGCDQQMYNTVEDTSHHTLSGLYNEPHSTLPPYTIVDMERSRMGSPQRTFLIGARLLFGLLGLTAIVTQLTIQIQKGFSLVNFFSYFTNLSNVFAAIVLLIGAFYLIQHREPTATGDIIRGAAVVCMAIVGIVFSILLRNEDLGSLLPWVNTVLHYIMPVVVVLDWLYQPPKTKLTISQIGYWLIFPFLYLVYSVIRGAIVGFYAYPFFNPNKVGGYGGVALYCLAILIGFIIVSWLVMLVGNALKRRVP